MKPINRSLLFMLAFGLGLTARAQTPEKTPVAHWDMTQCRETADPLTVPDLVSKNDLLVGNGANIEHDATAPGGISLCFDGTQSDWAVSTSRILVGPGLVLSLQAKPVNLDSPQTLVYAYGAYELRLIPTTGGPKIEFNLWKILPATKALSVRGDILVRKWNTIELEINASNARLVVNGQEYTITFPENTTLIPASQKFGIGSGGKAVPPATRANRAYIGSVTDIRLFTRKP